MKELSATDCGSTTISHLLIKIYVPR